MFIQGKSNIDNILVPGKYYNISFSIIYESFDFYDLFNFSEHRPMTESVILKFNSSLATVLSSFGILTIDNNIKSLSYRIIVFFVCLVGAVVYWSYCATLVSRLSVSNRKLPINNLEDLLSNKEYYLLILNGSMTYNYFSEATYKANPVAYTMFQEIIYGKNQPTEKGI